MWNPFSGRELFLLDSSVFVDDVEAYEKYQREEESDASEQKVISQFCVYIFMHVLNYLRNEPKIWPVPVL